MSEARDREPLGPCSHRDDAWDYYSGLRIRTDIKLFNPHVDIAEATEAWASVAQALANIANAERDILSVKLVLLNAVEEGVIPRE